MSTGGLAQPDVPPCIRSQELYTVTFLLFLPCFIHIPGGERRGSERVLRQHERGPHPDRRQRHRHLRGQHGRQEAALGRLKERDSYFTQHSQSLTS